MTSSLFGGQKTEKLCSDWLKSCVIPSRYWEAVFVWPAYWNFSCGNASIGNSFSINAAVCFHFESVHCSDLPSTDQRSSRWLWVWQIINGSKPLLYFWFNQAPSLCMCFIYLLKKCLPLLILYLFHRAMLVFMFWLLQYGNLEWTKIWHIYA